MLIIDLNFATRPCRHVKLLLSWLVPGRMLLPGKLVDEAPTDQRDVAVGAVLEPHC